MPNTGAFHLLFVVGKADYTDEILEELSSVLATCRGCATEFNANSPASGLERISGGVVLTCPKCSNRQAISGARFASFMKRLGDENRA